jgi:hypothetical protein
MNGKTLAARIALVGVLLAAAKPALAGTDYVQLSTSFPKPVPTTAVSQPYVPFVTDFGKPAAGPAVSPPYVPFVTDFPKPEAVPAAAPHLLPPVPEASSNGAWDELGLAAGVGAALVALLAASSLALTRLSRKEQWR